MKTTLSIIGIVVLGFFLLTAAGISPAVGEVNKLGGNEGPVMVASETASFGTEDWIGPIKTASFGTEDWVGPIKTASFGTEDWIGPIKTASFGTEDWIGAVEYSDVVETGTLPASARQELSLDDYYPD